MRIGPFCSLSIFLCHSVLLLSVDSSGFGVPFLFGGRRRIREGDVELSLSSSEIEDFLGALCGIFKSFGAPASFFLRFYKFLRRAPPFYVRVDQISPIAES